MIDKSQLRALLPHTGEMCLLDSVEEWSPERIRCTALSHCSPSNPLRHRDRLAALHIVEYAAQAIAIHGGLVKNSTLGEAPMPGMMAALRNVAFHVSRLDTFTEPLSITATRQLSQPGGVVYDFAASAGEQPIGEGRIVIALGAPGRPGPATA
jgi:predicted hotdog family 3-hydroxylacyl-ACP dehydratase